MTIRIATRTSQLAMAQSGWVANEIAAALGCECELVGLNTRGDTERGPLVELGGKGLFTAELETALRERTLELAVHSAKDMPAEMDSDLVIAAVPPREDPRDALVSRYGGLDSLSEGATVGTGSVRRAAALLALRPDVNIVPIRGNVQTRLARAAGDDADLDAVLLAMAGLNRSGLSIDYGDVIFPLATDDMIPAGGQGILVVQTHESQTDLIEQLRAVDCAATREALLVERAVLRGLGASCQSCVAVYVEPIEGGWRGVGMNGSDDGEVIREVRLEFETSAELADELTRAMEL